MMELEPYIKWVCAIGEVVCDLLHLVELRSLMKVAGLAAQMIWQLHLLLVMLLFKYVIMQCMFYSACS